MTGFFIYNQTSDILIDKLTKAELIIYREIQKLSAALNHKYFYATIDYLINHTEYNSKSFVSKTLKRLTEKGLILRELVQSNKSIHKVYHYYLVQDLTLTTLYQNLSDDEKKKYVVSVKADAEPYTKLTEEQNRLYCYLKYTAGIQDLTHKKLLILLDCARQNADIVPGTELETIKLMSKYCMDSKISNKFGYLKRTIINYNTEPKATYISVPKDTEQLTEPQERLYKACISMGVRLSTKQIKAIVSVAGVLNVDVSKVITIISNVIHIQGIQDIFKYILGCIRNYSRAAIAEAEPEQNQQSYDMNLWDSFAITCSENKGKPGYFSERKNE